MFAVPKSVADLSNQLVPKSVANLSAKSVADLSNQVADQVADLSKQVADQAAFALSEAFRSGSKAGNISYANGDNYEGETLGGAQLTRHGSGIYQFRDSGGQARYEGEYLNDERHGRGTLFYESGDVYDGQWCNHEQHGHGVDVHWSPDAGIWTYVGEFCKGQRSGSGVLTARERGALFGTWDAGSLTRGAELQATRLGPRVSLVDAGTTGTGDAGATGAAAIGEPVREALSNSPQEWDARDVRFWLLSLGVGESLEAISTPSSGAQLLELSNVDHLTAELSDNSSARRSVLNAAHAALCHAVEESRLQLSSWQEFQTVLPGIRRRTIQYQDINFRQNPNSEAVVAARGPQLGEWRGLTIELFPLPLRLPVDIPRAESEAAAGEQEGNKISAIEARDWVRDFEALATARHPHLGKLIGVTVGPPDPELGGSALMLVHEATKFSQTLFEFIHATLQDGSKRTMDSGSKLQICVGICEAMVALASKGMVCGALCSVNVEVVQSGQELTARLTRVGSSWWRWGWRVALRERTPTYKRKGLGIEEIIKKYAMCPVNWLAPEVLRGSRPEEPSDVYSFGLLLWEILYRSIPFGDFSIAQIIGAVGYGRRPLQSSASPGASTDTCLLHEVQSRCAHLDVQKRPTFSILLDAFRDVQRAREKRKSRGVLGKLNKFSDKTEAFITSGLFGGSRPAPTGPAGEAGGGCSEETRTVRVGNGEVVRVDDDLVAQFPADEDKWRTLMAFRARLK